MMRAFMSAAIGLAALGLMGTAALAQANTVTIAYQDMVNPWRLAMAEKALEKASGWTVNWRQYGGGGEVVRAMAAGEAQIGEAGSSAIAAAVSQGTDVQLFWILEDIGNTEALIVSNRSGLYAPAALKGRKIATPFLSTSHYHLMVALKEWGLSAEDLQILYMTPNDIAAAWQRDEIDGAFIWDPVLAQAKKNGHVLITSGMLSDMGHPTFDGLVADRRFARANPGFMVALVRTIAAADERYRRHHGVWTPDSREVAAISRLTGTAPEQVPATLAAYRFLTPEEQASESWLGGGKEGGAARALADTAAFLKEQKRISELLPDYSIAVDPSFVEQALPR